MAQLTSGRNGDRAECRYVVWFPIQGGAGDGLRQEAEPGHGQARTHQGMGVARPEADQSVLASCARGIGGGAVGRGSRRGLPARHREATGRPRGGEGVARRARGKAGLRQLARMAMASVFRDLRHGFGGRDHGRGRESKRRLVSRWSGQARAGHGSRAANSGRGRQRGRSTAAAARTRAGGRTGMAARAPWHGGTMRGGRRRLL